MIEMREKRFNVAFVLNEYGSCAGMITLEDLLEEIVGEIRDEYDADEDELIQEIGERQYLVEGGMKLDDINDALDTELESEDYDSIGGIIIEILDRMPVPGDEVTTQDGITLRVEDVQQNRITKVLMTLPEPVDSDEESEEDTDTRESFLTKETGKKVLLNNSHSKREKLLLRGVLFPFFYAAIFVQTELLPLHQKEAGRCFLSYR